MTIEERTRIEDEISPINSDLTINKNYDAQFIYYERKMREKQFTEQLLQEDVDYGNQEK